MLPLTIAVSTVNSYAVDMMAGGTIGLMEVDYLKNEKGEKLLESFDCVAVTALFDVEYARFGVGISRNYSPMHKKNRETGDRSNAGGYTYMNGILNAVGKYPFSFMDGSFKLWPCMGFEYLHTIRYTKDGENLKDDNNCLSDLYVTGGIGADYFFTKSIAVTLLIDAGYNLTPSPSSNSPSGSSYMGYALSINVGIMMRL
ncbi:MAG TPA: hypothetical protein PLC67_02715 [Spirochaetota bacterium]|nr:hypothetical protein [Spirochaetota bacterium]